MESPPPEEQSSSEKNLRNLREKIGVPSPESSEEVNQFPNLKSLVDNALSVATTPGDTPSFRRMFEAITANVTSKNNHNTAELRYSFVMDAFEDVVSDMPSDKFLVFHAFSIESGLELNE